MPSPDAAAIELALRALGTAERAVKEKAYLKSDLEFAGTGLQAAGRLPRKAAGHAHVMRRADGRGALAGNIVKG